MSDPDISVLIADIREQLLFMQELGVDSLPVELRDNAKPPASVVTETLIVGSGSTAKTSIPISSEPPKRPGSRLESLPSLRARRGAPPVPAHSSGAHTVRPEAVPPTLVDIAPTLETSADTIESIRADIGDCIRCKLHTGRTQVVHTTGNFQADLMFIGEAPGADEDAQGVPFVGKAGQLLTKIIESIGLKREDVCIGNVNRCRPPGNRQPEPDEASTCRPFLLREIEVVRPKVIVVLGAHAAHNLLQVKTPISRLRGNFHDYFGVKVMPTFHPAYLLRDPHKKREVWDDMKKVRDYLYQTK